MGNNLLKPYQVNFIDRAISFFKLYTKLAKEQNESIGGHILRFLIELVQGPCRDNQLEAIKKKLLEPLEDFHCNLVYSTYKINRETRIELINQILTLKLGIIESTKEKLIIKTLTISLNMELIWLRITAIYCEINDIKLMLASSEDQDSILKASQEMAVPSILNKDMINNLLGFNEDRPDAASNTKTRKTDKHSSYSINMVEALNSIILLSQLSNFGEDITNIIETSYLRISQEFKVISKARKFFTDRIQSIEFVDVEQNLQTLYFYIHPKTEFISKITINKFEGRVDRRNWTSKATDLIKFVPKAYLEINHNYSLYMRLNIHVSVSYFYFFKFLNFTIAIIINLIFVTEKHVPDEVNDTEVFRSWQVETKAERAAQVMCYFMLLNYIVAFILYIVYEFIIKIKIFLLEEHEKEIAFLSVHGTSVRQEGFFYLRRYFSLTIKTLFDTKILLVAGLLTCCVLGITVSKMYFAFLLLDIIEISPILLNVIKSVTINFASLSTTFGFIIIMAFIYSSIIFYNQSIRENMTLLDQDNIDFCDNYPTCFWNTLGYGIRAGGGLGDVMAMPDARRNLGEYVYVSFFYMIFHITMLVILMNIILGIIIDSFAELRDIRNQIENDISNVCFICNITKQEFNNNGISYTKHTRLVHSMWNYVFYIVGLLEKDPNEYTGIESYIAAKYAEKELDWLPFQQTAMLKKRTVSEEEARDMKINRIEDRIEEICAFLYGSKTGAAGGVVTGVNSINGGGLSFLGSQIGGSHHNPHNQHPNSLSTASARELKMHTNSAMQMKSAMNADK